MNIAIPTPQRSGMRRKRPLTDENAVLPAKRAFLIHPDSNLLDIPPSPQVYKLASPSKPKPSAGVGTPRKALVKLANSQNLSSLISGTTPLKPVKEHTPKDHDEGEEEVLKSSVLWGKSVQEKAVGAEMISEELSSGKSETVESIGSSAIDLMRQVYDSKLANLRTSNAQLQGKNEKLQETLTAMRKDVAKGKRVKAEHMKELRYLRSMVSNNQGDMTYNPDIETLLGHEAELEVGPEASTSSASGCCNHENTISAAQAQMQEQSQTIDSLRKERDGLVARYEHLLQLRAKEHKEWKEVRRQGDREIEAFKSEARREKRQRRKVTEELARAHDMNERLCRKLVQAGLRLD